MSNKRMRCHYLNSVPPLPSEMFRRNKEFTTIYIIDVNKLWPRKHDILFMLCRTWFIDLVDKYLACFVTSKLYKAFLEIKCWYVVKINCWKHISGIFFIPYITVTWVSNCVSIRITRGKFSHGCFGDSSILRYCAVSLGNLFRRCECSLQ